jgi:DNA-directed RNA polymerase subunit RPC12/RpoP
VKHGIVLGTKARPSVSPRRLCCLSASKLRPLGDIRRDPPRLIAWPVAQDWVSHASRGFVSQAILGVLPICTIRPLRDFRSFALVGQWVWVSVMGLDAGRVFKRLVLCLHCSEDYLFTLRAIAGNQELRCPGCGGSIRLSDRAYEQLLSDVGNALDEIDCAPPSFVTAHYRPAL